MHATVPVSTLPRAAARRLDLDRLDVLGGHALRWSLVFVFLWFGGMKFTAYEAAGIAPFTSNSPLFAWLHDGLGERGSSYAIGVLELATCAALAVGAVRPAVSVLGALMSMATYALTLTFLLTTPGVAEQSAGGFPAISAAPGQFLLKDSVLLAASFMLLVRSLRAIATRHEPAA